MAILSCNFISRSLGRTVPFTAVLPTINFMEMMNEGTPIYSDPKPFRTLYLLHGIGNNHMDWIAGTRVAHYAEENKLAVIMPAGENGFYTDNNGADRYGQYIGEELVKATRALFNLSHKREDTFIGGLSMGGYGALRNGLKYSDTFGGIIALSSAIVTDDAVNSTDDAPVFFGRRSYYESVFGDLAKLAGSDNDLYALAKRNASKTRLYMACGTQDMLIEKNRAFKAFLEENKVPFTYEEGPGGHEWQFWDTYINKGIQWLNDGE